MENGKVRCILVVGASGSGKDYEVDWCCRNYDLKKVMSKTTRKPRFEGEDTHLFVSEYIKECEYDSAIAKTCFNGNYYWTTKEDLKGKDFYIIDRDGVLSMPNREDYDVVYIKVPVWTRIKRMRKRGDSWRNVISRVFHDWKAFKGMNDIADYIFYDGFEFRYWVSKRFFS